MPTENGETHPLKDGNREYVPYSQSELTESMKEWAAATCNDTPEMRSQCLTEMKEKLREDPNLNFHDDDHFLLNFLRCTKFDVPRATSMARRFYAFIDSHEDIFRRVAPEIVERVIKANIIGFLPYRDQKNRAIVVLRAEAWDVDEIPVDDVAFGTIVSLKSAADNPMNQIMGFVAVADLKNLSARQILTLGPKYLIMATRGLQYVCPCKVSAFHVINVSPVYKIAWKLIKPMLSEKIRKRIMFHKSDTIASLHKYISPRILPSEFEGELGPFDNGHWSKDLEKILKSYYEDMKYGYINKS